MTNPDNPIPTAAEALGEAVAIARSMTNGLPADERARLWLAIAHEISEDARWRSVDRRLSGLRPPRVLTEPALRDGGIITAERAGTVARAAQMVGRGLRLDPGGYEFGRRDEHVRIDPAGYVGVTGTVLLVPAADAPTEVVPVTDLGATQKIPIVWEIGDKADCRNCHTPIELQQVAVQHEGEPPAVWRHKYSGQAVCADIHIGPAEGGFEGHTFAEPAERG